MCSGFGINIKAASHMTIELMKDAAGSISLLPLSRAAAASAHSVIYNCFVNISAKLDLQDVRDKF